MTTARRNLHTPGNRNAIAARRTTDAARRYEHFTQARLACRYSVKELNGCVTGALVHPAALGLGAWTLGTNERIAFTQTARSARVAAGTKRAASRGRAVGLTDATKVARIAAAVGVAKGVAWIADRIAERGGTMRFAKAWSTAATI